MFVIVVCEIVVVLHTVCVKFAYKRMNKEKSAVMPHAVQYLRFCRNYARALTRSHTHTVCTRSNGRNFRDIFFPVDSLLLLVDKLQRNNKNIKTTSLMERKRECSRDWTPLERKTKRDQCLLYQCRVTGVPRERVITVIWFDKYIDGWKKVGIILEWQRAKRVTNKKCLSTMLRNKRGEERVVVSII